MSNGSDYAEHYTTTSGNRNSRYASYGNKNSADRTAYHDASTDGAAD